MSQGVLRQSVVPSRKGSLAEHRIPRPAYVFPWPARNEGPCGSERGGSSRGGDASTDRGRPTASVRTCCCPATNREHPLA
jgi:hypothetical protein